MSTDLSKTLGSSESDGVEEREPTGPSAFQWLVVGSGTAVALGGLVAAFAGTIEVATPILFVVGASAFLLAAWRGYTYAATGTSVTAVPTVGLRAGVRRTGSELDDAIRRADGRRGQERDSGRVSVKRRLEPLAARLLAERESIPEQEATGRLRSGTWTDDETAAHLFEQRGDDGFLAALVRRTPSTATQVQAVLDDLGAGELDGIETTVTTGDGEETLTSDQRWEPGVRETGRWRGISAAGLATLAAAVFARSPGLVLVAAILVGVGGYARLGSAPEPTLAVERSVDDEDPRPGDHVTVTVSVENRGEGLLPDLRVVDDVPADLRVVDGTPQHATALRPGETAEFDYDVLAVYGDHDFEQLYTVAYDATGHHERTGECDDGRLTLTCEPRPVQESVPLHPQTTGVTGRVTTDTGGSGHEFHSVREYRRGDPLRRVDWNRVARTGDLATLQFREEHAATVVVLVDTRAASFQAPDRDALSAVDRSLAGAAQVYESLLSDGDRVGLANVGLDWTWIPPGAGSDHRERVRETLQRDPNFSGQYHEVNFAVDRYVRRLRRRLPSDAQLLLFSPLLDEKSAAVARRLHAHGHSVTAFSLDPTTTASVGATVTRIERTLALSTLRAAGIPVVDWGHDEPLAVAVERAERGWRR